MSINFRPTIPPPEYFKTYSAEEPPQEEKPKSTKGRNVLLGSLMALASLSIPTIITLENDRKSYNHLNYNEPQNEIVCNPTALAKGGENDSIVELKELMNILDFSPLDGLSKRNKSAIETVAMANLKPVILGKDSKKAEKEIIEQIKSVQEWIDSSAEQCKTNPHKSPDEMINDYQRKYVTGDEILDGVDFSEIKKYQKDITLLRALIRCSIKRINRSDRESLSKIREEINNAQKLVDQQTEKCIKYSKIAGNSDYNDRLSKEEFRNLLDLQSLEGLMPEQQKSALKNAMNQYKPIVFTQVKDKQDIQETNQRILESLQKAQDALDSEANSYK